MDVEPGRLAGHVQQTYPCIGNRCVLIWKFETLFILVHFIGTANNEVVQRHKYVPFADIDPVGSGRFAWCAKALAKAPRPNCALLGYQGFVPLQETRQFL
ncbi:hypothetical protein ASG68_23930 [Rhizobium sp. Leaf453]|nr:hypothetical protein ASG68_23930 [Rhizobium sp. Leaf453]